MNILIIGAGGMIGHKMFQILKAQGHRVTGTIRQAKDHYDKFKIFTEDEIIDLVDVSEFEKTENILNSVKPEIILNCVGITLRKPEVKNLEYCKKINSEFPHFLKKWTEVNNSYLIHFSTDCVFSGKDGPYTEESLFSAEDIYGKTKAAGEVTGSQALTLRGSMIGRELYGKTELLEWVIAQRGKQIKGFSNAIYTGVTTNLMAKLVAGLILLPNKLTGVYQVSSEPISKLELLKLINDCYKLNLTIIEDSGYSTSKILMSEKLKRNMGFNCPKWPEMVDDLTKDLFNYDV